jgi:hypothetical protein
MGVDELPNFPKNYFEQLLLPFVYKPGLRGYRSHAPGPTQSRGNVFQRPLAAT